ncbi:DUF1707 SHOCT-like domain-containing protein [Arachnia propionica]|uniref:DUF1707 SHOCT-like domain-containing protein n=1 Tax=Arachnia propionica TaxID=1750 RepID=UPI0013E0A134|nr:DUF1707 domain-containing protein [Arachnia propionica]
MSEKLPKGSSQRGQIRAGDLDRDEVLKMLQDAYAADQLSREEFEDRQQFCLKARYVGDLSDLISDLPGGARWRKEEPSDEPSERIIVTDNIYPYSEVVVLRRGTVRMSPSMSTIRSVTVLGGSSIHIEDIMAPGGGDRTEPEIGAGRIHRLSAVAGPGDQPEHQHHVNGRHRTGCRR